MMKQRIRGRWSYLRGQEAARSRSYSISSSSTSGTLSTAYTASSSSRMSSGYLASAMHFDFELLELDWAAMTGEEQIHHIENLVREFSGGNVSVPERWLTELGIGWVLHLPLPGAAASSDAAQTYEYDAPSWIRALVQVVEIIGLMPHISPLRQLPNNYYDTEKQAAPKFFHEAMFNMLPFVDWIVASSGMKMQPPYENLSTLLALHGALSKALPQIQMASSLLSSAEVLRIHNNLVSRLAAKEVMAGDAIWSIMKQIRARFLEPTEEDNVPPLEAGSSDIHKATRSVISYIRLLQANYSSLARVVSVKCLSHNAPVPPLDSMIIEIASSLEEKVAKESESFPDCGLKFLFLLNNSYYIWSVIQDNPVAANNISFLSSVQTHEANTTHSRRVDSYMDSYMQVSWAPVLSSLFNNPTQLCLGKNKNYSPLAKFETEFQKTYTTQKLWKVPDPGLRKNLREAIAMKIMPDYTKYIEDNNIITSGIAPQELEEMLQELFEG